MKIHFYIIVCLRAALHAAVIAGEGVVAMKTLDEFFQNLAGKWFSSESVSSKPWTALTEDEQFDHFKRAMGISPDESLAVFKSKMASELVLDDLRISNIRENSFVSSYQFFLISHIPEEKRTPAQNEWLRLFPAIMFDQKPAWKFKEMNEFQKEFAIAQSFAVNDKRVLKAKLEGLELRLEDPLSPAQQGWIMNRPVETLTKREIDWMIEKEGRRAGSLRDFDWTFDEDGRLHPVEARRAHNWLQSFFHIDEAEAALVIFQSEFASFLDSFFNRIRNSPDSPVRSKQLKFIFRYFHDDPSDTGKRIFQELSIQQALHQVDLLS